MAKSKKPLAELAARARRITPRMLRGAKRELWEEMVTGYCDGQYVGLSMKELYEWARKHCGLTCSLSCFRQELSERAKTQDHQDQAH